MKKRIGALLQVCSNDSTHAAVSVPLAWLQIHGLKVKDKVQVSYDDEKVVIRPLRLELRKEENNVKLPMR